MFSSGEGVAESPARLEADLKVKLGVNPLITESL